MVWVEVLIWTFVSYLEAPRVACVNVTLGNGDVKVLLNGGKLFTVSEGCQSSCDDDEAISWGHWSACTIPIPGNLNNQPQCYNSLRNRQRPCNVTDTICRVLHWEFCLHKESCNGQWSQWAIFSDDCVVDCTTHLRNRTCMRNGTIAAGLCYPSSYGSKTDIEVQVCLERHCKSIVWIYAATLGGRCLLLVIILVFGAWMKRCNRPRVKRRRKQRSSPTYRHYSFAVDHPDLRVVNSTLELTSENFYEQPDIDPAPDSDIPSYASAVQTSNENVYEMPMQSTRLKYDRKATESQPPMTVRSYSADDIITKHTNVYQDDENDYMEGPSSRSNRDLRDSTSPEDFHTHHQKSPSITSNMQANTAENAAASDEELYLPMRSPSNTERAV